MKLSSVLKITLSLLMLIMVLSLTTTAQMSSPDGKVRVWVQFQPGAKGAVEKALHAAGAEVHYTFDELDAFVVSLPEQALEGIRHNPNVVLIEEDAQRQMLGQTVPYGVDMVQARDVWDANRDGAVDAGAPTGNGRIVCIIDSGLYVQHEDLQTVKIKGGYPTGWNTDKCGHGTHVAGTIAAANNGVGVVGVNPGGAAGPELYIVKVFGDDCAWAYSSTLVDAANRCQAAGANIISMSLGGTTKSVLEQNAFNNLNNAGILSIAAAGNDGNTRVSYPAGYSSVVSVAAVDDQMAVASFSQQNADVEIAAPGVGVLSTVPWIATANLVVGGTTYTGSPMEFSAPGTATGALVSGGLCDTVGAWTDKVVLCERGTIDFGLKVSNAQAGGGAAAIIYNNVAGGFSGTLGTYVTNIPAISLSQADGQALVASSLGLDGTVTSSTTYNSTGGYEAWDGTSMATPHVSGVAALIWSANPSWTNTQVRSAMTSTAKDLGAAGRDNAYGYGLVQAKAALTALQNGGGGTTGTLSAAVTTNKTSYVNAETVTITVTVKDGANAAVSGAAVSPTITTPKNKKVTLPSGSTNTSGVATFTYTVNTKTGGTGTYTISVTASKTGYTSTTASGTFTAK